jgi:hypothetical protein
LSSTTTAACTLPGKRIAIDDCDGEMGGLKVRPGPKFSDDLELGGVALEPIMPGFTFHELRLILFFFLTLAWYAARIAADASSVVLHVLAALGGRPV